MKRNLAVFIAVIALGCAFLLGSLSPARAEEQPCTTQGALALALADVLGLKVTGAQDAADALAALGVKPALGWDVEACLTDAVSGEVARAYAGLNRDAEGFNRALGMLLRHTDRQYQGGGVPPPPPPPPPVSPFKP